MNRSEARKAVWKNPEKRQRIISGLKGMKHPNVYKERTCVLCGDVYIPKSSNQKYCLQGECKKRLSKIQGDNERLKKFGYLGYRIRECFICGKEFKPKTSRQKTCENGKCRKLLNNMLKNKHMKKIYARDKLKPEFICKRLILRTIDRMVNHKNFRAFNYVNFTKEQFKNHIESLFTVGMSWNNYGEWEIDHIKPLVLFNFVDLDGKENFSEIKKANSLSNLQPLWKEDNRKKGATYAH